ncbi:uncharacterized protein AAG666_015639 isoform 1-T1 [Megaptera novaeangliae]
MGIFSTITTLQGYIQYVWKPHWLYLQNIFRIQEVPQAKRNMRPTINLDLHQEMKSMGNGVKQACFRGNLLWEHRETVSELKEMFQRLGIPGSFQHMMKEVFQSRKTEKAAATMSPPGNKAFPEELPSRLLCTAHLSDKPDD